MFLYQLVNVSLLFLYRLFLTLHFKYDLPTVPLGVFGLGVFGSDAFGSQAKTRPTLPLTLTVCCFFFQTNSIPSGIDIAAEPQLEHSIRKVNFSHDVHAQKSDGMLSAELA